MADDETLREINRLYWGTDASVGEIAERLGVSRRALYDNIEPIPTGTFCPDCSGALGFRNRTAAENRDATCPDCGHERRLSPEELAGESPPADDPEIERQERGAALAPMPPRAVPTSMNAPVLSGAMLAGLAVGAALTLLAKRG